jgi:hypothetical protein
VQADTLDGQCHVGAVVDHELAFARNRQLELTCEVDELTGGQVVVAQLYKVDATGDGVLYELDEIAILGVGFANY